MDGLADLVLLGVAVVHVLCAPYTKVEESFNLHATHDVFMYGVKNLANYDHFVFPGAVPRTFIGSVLLAWITKALTAFSTLESKLDVQIWTRITLAIVNSTCLCVLRRAVKLRYGTKTSLFFVLLSCSQFHLPFWMGRTVPNMFALPTVTLALALYIVDPANALALSLLTAGGVIFRAELALLLAPLCLQMLALRQIPFRKVVIVGFVSAALSIATTVLVDSYFWQQLPIWPEFSSIFFNVYEGKSAEWGVSPPWTYFTSFLPKLLLTALPLAILGYIADPRIRQVMNPTIAFVVLLSFLGHKEWRFIVYVVPFFNIGAARGAVWLCSRRKNSIVGKISFMLPFLLLGMNLAYTAVSMAASAANYPGAEALLRVNHFYEPYHYRENGGHIYISNLAAQTGASLFLQEYSQPYLHRDPERSGRAQLIYNKTENLSMSYLLSPDNTFTDLILEERPNLTTEVFRYWDYGGTIQTFDRVSLRKNLLRSPLALIRKPWDFVDIRTRDALWILRRN